MQKFIEEVGLVERVISRAHSLVRKLVTADGCDKAAQECLLDLSRDILHSRGALRLELESDEADAEVEIRRPSRRTREAELRGRTQREALLKLAAEAVRSGSLSSDFTRPSAPLSDSQALVAFFAAPVEREYVLRATVPPRESSALAAPQRLHALISRDSVHISGAFSRETLAI